MSGHWVPALRADTPGLHHDLCCVTGGGILFTSAQSRRISEGSHIMSTIRRTIASIKRTTVSTNGNPAYFIGFTDGTRARTQSDTSWAYAVDTHMVGSTFDFTMTPAGRIRYGHEVTA